MVLCNVLDNEGRVLLEMLDALRQGAQSTTAVTVRILAAADHDGVCAAKILVTVLQRAGVKYTVVPVTGNAEIIEHMQQLGEDSEVRSLVMLNCGAALDLQQQLEDNAASSQVRVFVVDAHRPFLMANLSMRADRVLIIDDDPIAEASGMRPPDPDEDEVETEDAEDDDEAEDQPDDGEEETWAPGNGNVNRPRPVLVDRRDRKRRRMIEREEWRERKRLAINDYYMSAYYAAPAAMSLFKMAKQAGSPSQDLLWAAAVSLTGYLELGLLSRPMYERLAWEELKEALENTDLLSSAPPSSQVSGSTAPELGATPASDDEGGSVSTGRRPAPRGAGPGRRLLRFEKELQLTLYKHWCLEDSIKHSAYFHDTLQLSRDRGLRALKKFFATSGIPPNDYRQQYSSMQLPIRKTLHQKFRDRGREYGLNENKMFLQQFVREPGPVGEENPALHLQEITCMDAAFVITSILSSVPGFLSGSKAETLPRMPDGRRDAPAVVEMERQVMVDNFWRAFDTVMCKEPKAMREGIIEAVGVAKAVQSMARLIRDSKAMHGSRSFRWCKVEQPPHIFRHHLAVRRLATWLLQVNAANRARNDGAERPLLMIMNDPVRETYLCVGATPRGLNEPDEFGYRFRSVLRAERSLRYRYDYFDKSCIEISRDDFDRFWELMVDAV